MSTNISSTSNAQPIDPNHSAANNQLMMEFSAKFDSINQRSNATSQSIFELSQNIGELDQIEKTHHQNFTTQMNEMISTQKKANEIIGTINEQTKLTIAYQQRVINSIKCIAWIFFNPFRRKPPVIECPVNLAIIPPLILPTQSTQVGENHSNANDLPKKNVNQSNCIRFTLWISKPIRWFCYFAKSIIFALAQKKGLIHRNNHPE